jgi:hypothetical protein
MGSFPRIYGILHTYKILEYRLWLLKALQNTVDTREIDLTSYKMYPVP